jgi:leucyl-tRNA synthetase
MEFSNALWEHAGRKGATPAFQAATTTLIHLLSPLAPHMTEELWARRGGSYSIHSQSWPGYDPELARDEAITLVVQVNGKVRDRIRVPAGLSNDEARAYALDSEQIQRIVDGTEPQKVIVVPGRLVNIVLS